MSPSKKKPLKQRSSHLKKASPQISKKPSKEVAKGKGVSWQGIAPQEDDRWIPGGYQNPIVHFPRDQRISLSDVSASHPNFTIQMTEAGNRRLSNNHESGELRVPASMLYHGFQFPLTDDFAKLLFHFNVCPRQLPPLVMLIYERAKLLESEYKVPFGYSEIIRYIYVVEKERCDNPQLGPIFNVRFYKRSYACKGLPSGYRSWSLYDYIIKGPWNTTSYPISSDFRCKVIHERRRPPENKVAERNLEFYLTQVDASWRQLQKPNSIVQECRKVHKEAIPCYLRSIEDVPPMPQCSRHNVSDHMTESSSNCEIQPMEKSDESSSESGDDVVHSRMAMEKTLSILSIIARQKLKATVPNDKEAVEFVDDGLDELHTYGVSRLPVIKESNEDPLSNSKGMLSNAEQGTTNMNQNSASTSQFVKNLGCSSVKVADTNGGLADSLLASTVPNTEGSLANRDKTFPNTEGTWGNCGKNLANIKGLDSGAGHMETICAITDNLLPNTDQSKECVQHLAISELEHLRKENEMLRHRVHELEKDKRRREMDVDDFGEVLLSENFGLRAKLAKLDASSDLGKSESEMRLQAEVDALKAENGHLKAAVDQKDKRIKRLEKSLVALVGIDD